MKITVDTSDLEKILDTLSAATQHHVFRDESNAKLHLAATARWSPLTSELIASRDRLTSIINTGKNFG